MAKIETLTMVEIDDVIMFAKSVCTAILAILRYAEHFEFTDLNFKGFRPSLMVSLAYPVKCQADSICFTTAI